MVCPGQYQVQAADRVGTTDTTRTLVSSRPNAESDTEQLAFRQPLERAEESLHQSREYLKAHYDPANIEASRSYRYAFLIGSPTPNSSPALDTMIFPQGTTGYVIDAIARRPLWSEGLDYRHGTGHGVGAFLNVHEGPHGIGQRPQFNEHPLRAGNVVSNEPGYYADGKFGIRIENCVVVKPSDTPNNFGNKGYLEFEHVTMVSHCLLARIQC